MKLMKLYESAIGTILKNIKIAVKIDKTAHADLRQSRHDKLITDKDILATADKALIKITKMLIYDKLDINDKIVIFDSVSTLNLVCSIEEGGGKIDLIIITVMRSKNFHSPRNQKVVRV